MGVWILGEIRDTFKIVAANSCHSFLSFLRILIIYNAICKLQERSIKAKFILLLDI